jgi:uncharacterized protein YbjT (DUF2867 family)
MNSVQSVLVIGATGRVGRHAVTNLLERGVRVRALVRDPERARLPAAAELRRGDLRAPESVAQAASGAEAAFLLWPWFDASGAAPVVESLAAQVGRIVQLSAAELQRGKRGAKPGVWADVEALVAASAAQHTFLRAGGFAANTLSWADQIRRGDTVRIPYLQAGRSLVHERDLAEAAVAALLHAADGGKTYELTGPRTLRQREQLEIIAAELGRTFTIEEASPDEASAELSAQLGETAARNSLRYWASLVDDPERVSDDVQTLTGHAPRSFETWVREHAAEF